MGTVQAKKLGDKYILLNLIGTGGMAEVYRSVLLGQQGFEKLIVIKKLLPLLVRDEEMIRFFIGEARLAALLQHENIAATYDFGEINGDFFLAMEYLAGKDLYTLMQRIRKKRYAFEPKHALMVTSKICEGMDYAHNLKDLHNNPLNIIHRDLSPHNIFITYDGKIKVLDFGVAKAEMFDNRTRADVVKGKISYMSPEQMSGENIDARSDIFSIGILLYEMISNKRMYSGDTATLIRKCISVDYQHLETILTDQPPELYALLHKALSNDLDSRYQSCAEMQTDIDDLLFKMAVRPGAKTLQKTIRNLFADEYDADQKQTIRTLESITDKELLPKADKTPAPIYDSPSDKTILYSTLEGSGSTKSLLPGIFKKGSARTACYALFATGTLLALGIFLLPGWMQEDTVVPAVSSPPVLIEPELSIKPESSLPPATPQLTEALETPETPEVQEVPEEDSAITDLPHEAQNSLETRLMPAPDEHQALQTLKRETEEKKQAAIDDLAGKAKQCRAENKIDSPPDDSVIFHYNEILKIDPDNILVRDGFLAIGDHYATIANKELAERNFSEAEKTIDTGLSVTPDHTELLNLKVDVQEQKQTAINKLNKKATQCLATNKLTTPIQNCAFFYYTKILKIDPSDVQALNGTVTIADQYTRMTKKALANQKYSKAKGYIQVGLSVAPNHTQLLSLKEELLGNNQTSAIHGLAEKAQQCYARDKLTTPTEDSAFFYYKEILKIDPGNILAEKGFLKIANRYTALAKVSFRQFNFDRTKKLINSGLKVVPDHAELLALQTDLNRGGPGAFFMSVDKNLKALFSD